MPRPNERSSEEGVTEKQLAHQVDSLASATIHNSQKYEAWLKAKKGREEDGENSDPS
jgi:hypothetical protein